MKIYFVIPENKEFAIYSIDLLTQLEKRVNAYPSKEAALEVANHNNGKVTNSQIYNKYLLKMF